MKSTSATRISRFLSIAMAGALVVGGIGCAASDAITFSKDSRQHGMSLYNNGQYADAAGSFRNAARQNPRDYHSYYMLGCSYAQMGQHQQAIGAFRTALDVQNVTLEGKYDDAQRIKSIDGLAGAIARSDTRDIEVNQIVAKARTQQSADDYLLLAKIHANRGDADSAIDAYEHAALLAPTSFPVVKSYGLYLEKLGQTSRAEASLRRAYAINQGDDQVNLALRRLGVVPGPSIKSQSELVKPPVPRGPIPEFDVAKMRFRDNNAANSANVPTPSPTPPPANTGPQVQAPRD